MDVDVPTLMTVVFMDVTGPLGLGVAGGSDRGKRHDPTGSAFSNCSSIEPPPPLRFSVVLRHHYLGQRDL